MKKPQGFSVIPVLAIVMALVVLTMIGWATVVQFTKPKPAANTNTTANVNEVACTADAKQCPDGSYVSRVPPSCEFAACPATNTNVTANTNTSVIPVDWKTYTNTEHSFSFSYPPSWTITEDKSVDPTQTVYVAKDPTGVDGQLSIAPKGYPGSGAPEGTVTNRAVSFGTVKGTQITLTLPNQSIWISYVNLEQDSVPQGWGWAHPIDLRVGSRNSLETLNRILTTFQFTDQTAATADWKTYTNIKYGYSVKYPPNWSAPPSGTVERASIAPPGADAQTSIELGPHLFIAQVSTILEEERGFDGKDFYDRNCVGNRSMLEINGVKATRQDQNCFATRHVTYFPQDSKYIQLQWPEVFDKDYPEYEQILSTFQFTDQTAAAKIIGQLDTPGNAGQLAMVGNTVYVSDREPGLQAIDVSDPAKPTLLSTYKDAGTIDAIAASGTLVFAFDSLKGVLILDAANPKSLKKLATFDTDQTVPVNGIVQNNTLFTIDVSQAMLEILDVSDHASPVSIGRVRTAETSGNRTIAAAGNFIYTFSDSSVNLFGIQIVDVSNKKQPKVVGSIPHEEGWPKGIFASGSYLYVARSDRGLTIYDVSNSKAPKKVGAIDTSGSANAIAVRGNRAFVADGAAGVQVIDISDPSRPTLLESIDTPGLGVDVVGTDKYLYVSDGDKGGLRVIQRGE